MFERYTERAKRVVFFARYEASERGSLSIGTEHLLLGLLREGKGRGVEVFAGLNVPLEAVQKAVVGRAVFTGPVNHSIEIPFTPETKRVLEFAAEEADRLQHEHIGTEHLLLGMLREQHSVAGSILVRQGMGLDAAREQVVLLRLSSM